MNETKVEACARAGYETVRAYRLAAGVDRYEQPTWKLTPDREHYRREAEAILAGRLAERGYDAEPERTLITCAVRAMAAALGMVVVYPARGDDLARTIDWGSPQGAPPKPARDMAAIVRVEEANLDGPPDWQAARARAFADLGRADDGKPVLVILLGQRDAKTNGPWFIMADGSKRRPGQNDNTGMRCEFCNEPQPKLNVQAHDGGLDVRVNYAIPAEKVKGEVRGLCGLLKGFLP